MIRLAAFLAVTLATSGAGAETAPVSKKEQRLADKAKAKAAPPEKGKLDRELKKRVGKKPPLVVNVYNTWTHEWVAIDESRAGSVEPVIPPESINAFLRCHFTNHEKPMDQRLFGVLLSAAKHFKVARVDVVSGFRAPKYNLMLRKKGRRVARNSQHTFGNAVDFRLPGVSTERLRDWAKKQRLGGVGYYQGDGFVHVDTGPIRYWVE